MIFSVNLFLFLIDDFDYKRNWDDVRKLNLPSLQDKTITRSCILSSPNETVAAAHPMKPLQKNQYTNTIQYNTIPYNTVQ